ncbi:hypothetical protein [Halorhabdus rudnickae]|uniref:hypothetical protein n=1 Tax=Halorhabdus rudnickae TaxID=1775544 RepID=UPI001082E18C|nr:hypothetical protein [Halorhabdus rudnickae]
MTDDTNQSDEGEGNGANDAEDGFERAGLGATSESPTDAGQDDTGATDAEADPLAELTQREDRLDQRELGLDKRAADLQERAAQLDEREAALTERAAELEEYRDDLEAREERIAQREDELDDREARIDDQEAALAERADELDRTERTLQNYVGDQVGDIEEAIGDTVEEAVSSAIVHYEDDGSDLGTTGNLLLGLAGAALLVGGTANAAAEIAGSSATILSSSTGNLGVGAALILIGLAVNLVAVTKRL